jgi:hypothetical protein
MSQAADAVLIARAMIAKFGERALAAASRRSELNEIAGEREAAAMWRLVGDTIRGWREAGQPPTKAGPPP